MPSFVRPLVACGLVAGLALGLGIGLRSVSGAQAVDDVPVPPTRVVVVGQPEWPLIQRVFEELRIRAQPTTEVRLMPFRGDAEFRADLRALGADLDRETLFFTPSQTYARVVQLEFPRARLVFAGINDPRHMCLVDDLRRPGRNATGYMHYLPSHQVKQLQLLLDAYPDMRQVLVLVSGHNRRGGSCDPNEAALNLDLGPCSPGVLPQDAEVSTMLSPAPLLEQAAARGVNLQFAVACSAADWGWITAMATQQQAGLMVPWHQLFMDEHASLVQAVRASGVPTVYPARQHVVVGGLMALEPIRGGSDTLPDWLWVLRQVLNGRDPNTMPVMQPRGLRLTVGAFAAASSQPMPDLSLLRRADEILP